MVAAIFSHTGGQNFDHSLILSQNCMLIQDASTKMVDALLTLIFKRK